MLSLDNYKKIIDDTHKKTGYLTFYFQGEPFLNKNLLSMLQYAKQHNMFTITSTNAHYINDNTAREIVKSGLSKLIISLDGTTQKSYEKYRIGGELSKVVSSAIALVNAKRDMKSKTPFLEFQFLVVKHNEHEIEEAQTLTKKLGLNNIVFKTAQIYDFEKGSELIPTIDKYSRYYKQANGTWAIKNKLLNHCWKLWNSCVVTWDGNVVPCCFDKDARYVMGNALTQPIQEIWSNTTYNLFRKKVLQTRKNIEMCANCSEGSLVYG
jgi:radical SAM protein with 4Fe4S-binding SPASM domain